jgi:DNA-binding NarL/FixJ family response regulator
VSTAAAQAGKIRILMVDDHPIVRAGMALFLNAQPDLDLCCEAGNAEEALTAMADYLPALAIVDISLQLDSGLDLIRTLRQHYPELLLLALSLHDEAIFAERALQAGANGYLMKHEASGNILLAVRQVLAGDTYLSAAMQARLSQQLGIPRKSLVGRMSSLSEREFQVLYLLGTGSGTREIAEKLNRSVKTIEAHRASLKDKLQLKSGADLVRYAMQSLAER